MAMRHERTRRRIGLAVLAVLAGIVTGTGWTGVAAGCAISEEVEAVDFIATVPTLDASSVIEDLLWRGGAAPKGFRRVTVHVEEVAVGVVHEVEDVDVSITPVCGVAPAALQAGQRYRFTGTRRSGAIAVWSYPVSVAGWGESVRPTGQAWHGPVAGTGSPRGRSWTDLNPVTVALATAAVVAPGALVRRRRRRLVSVTADARYDAPGWPAS